MKKKIVVAGGSGYLGKVIAGSFANTHAVVILSRKPAPAEPNIRTVVWDGRTMGDWAKELDGAEALINLTGKNVNCRYHARNRQEILRSRLDATAILGEAVALCMCPPKVWLQMSSATIYRHSTDKAMDEVHGETGEGFSVDVCKQWESTFNGIYLPTTRKVILRTAIVMGKNDGAFPRLRNLVRSGFGGRQGTGRQMVSWIHEDDFADAVHWLLERPYCSGVYNIAAPGPVTNDEMMKILTGLTGAVVSLRTPEWLLRLGAWLIGTEVELVLKSRWVVPRRLERDGFQFRFPTFQAAAASILSKTSKQDCQNLTATSLQPYPVLPFTKKP